MTSDGISNEDWEKIEELALAIVSAIQADDDIMSKIQCEYLHLALDSLEEIYGRLPSILATRGDFARDGENPIPFWEEAYGLALQRNDLKNVLYLSSSLANHYNDAKERDSALKWLVIGEKALSQYYDDFESNNLKEIRECLEKEMNDRATNS